MKYLALLLIATALFASLSLAHQVQFSVNVDVSLDSTPSTEEASVPAAVSLPESSNNSGAEIDSALSETPNQIFARWMRVFRKKWRTSEIVKRTRILRDNFMQIVRFNAIVHRTSDLGLNQYSDMDDEEFIQKIATVKPSDLPKKPQQTTQAKVDDATDEQLSQDIPPLPNIVRPIHIDPITGDGGYLPAEYQTDDFEFLSDEPDEVELDDAAAIPEYLNWAAKGKVVPPRDQGTCGSCWAFSSSDTISSVWAIKHNENPLLLSPQYLVDCNREIDPILRQANNGCTNGGAAMVYRFLYEHTHVLEEDYPYVGFQGRKCYDSKARKIPVKTNDIFGFYQMRRNPTDMINQLISTGPMVVYVAGSDLRFKNYRKGIITTCSEKVDHAVMLVGYGTQKGIDYWIIKNSWGEGYGEKGYVRVRRGTNTCGVEQEAIQPMV